MQILEHGQAQERTLLFFPCTAEPVWAFADTITLLSQRWHVFQVVYDGHQPEYPGDFTSVEQTVDEVISYLKSHGVSRLGGAYGCSMGGSVALLVALGQLIKIKHCVMDGGITPYQLPWIVTRFIALKDYLMMMIGRTGGVGLLEKAFATDEYTKEDLQYVADILRHCSRKTLWRTFDSCNNYKVPDPVPTIDTKLHYWYTNGEEKERKQDIAYIKSKFPQTEFTVLPELGHAGLVLLKPELFEQMISELSD